jgi:hypothetical protein
MLSNYFEANERIRTIRGGPGGALIATFERQKHLLQWAFRRDLSPRDLDERALKRFGAHLRRCNCGRYFVANRNGALAGSRFFLTYLRGDEPAMRERQPVPVIGNLISV